MSDAGTRSSNQSGLCDNKILLGSGGDEENLDISRFYGDVITDCDVRNIKIKMDASVGLWL